MLLRFSPLFSVDGVAPSEAPGIFGPASWSLAVEAGLTDIIILSLPGDGGSAITDIEASINGGGWASIGGAVPGTYPSAAVAGDEVRLRAVNVAGPALPSLPKPVPVAPTVTASDALAGRTLTVSVTGSTGTPAPSFSIAMTADEAAVTPTLTAPGVWAYSVPSDLDPVTLAWTVIATNGVSPNATASGSEVVPADLGVQLTAVDLQAQSGDDVPVSLTGDAGTYNWILTTTDPAVSPPSLAQVNAGQTHTGAPAPASGSVTVVNATPVSVALPDGLNGSYYLVVADADSIVFDATPQAINTLAGSWSFTDNGDGTFTIVSSPTPPAEVAIADNGDGTFSKAA